MRAPDDTFAITLLGNDLRADLCAGLRVELFDDRVAAIKAALPGLGLSIDSERSLSRGDPDCVEIIARANAAPGPGLGLERLRAELRRLGASHPGLDLVAQSERLYRGARRLAVFDMDSTLIQVEVIDELAKLAGVGAEVSAITEEAMQGRIDFTQSLTRRVQLLKGLEESRLPALAAALPLMPGAEQLVGRLRRLGCKTALVSGGFSFFGDRLKDRLGLDYAHTNTLEIVGGKLTGRVTGPVVDGRRKAWLLEQIAASEGIPLESVIAVGDGANDIPMLTKAGLGIAFNAKPKTREAAAAALNQRSLSSVLFLLGIADVTS